MASNLQFPKPIDRDLYFFPGAGGAGWNPPRFLVTIHLFFRLFKAFQKGLGTLLTFGIIFTLLGRANERRFLPNTSKDLKIVAAVANTVEHPEEIPDEMRHLLEVLGT